MRIFEVRFRGAVLLETLREREAKEYINKLYNDEQRNPMRIVPELWERDEEPRR